MTTGEYRSALAAAVREYESLGEQRREIDARLAQLAQTIGTLTRLLGLTPTAPFSITDAVRLAVRAGGPMSPTEVRDRLQSIGVDLSTYANDLAVIHTVLKRLCESGEVHATRAAGRKRAYRWAGAPRAVAVGTETAAFIRGLPAHPAFAIVDDRARAAAPRKPRRKA